MNLGTRKIISRFLMPTPSRNRRWNLEFWRRFQKIRISTRANGSRFRARFIGRTDVRFWTVENLSKGFEQVLNVERLSKTFSTRVIDIVERLSKGGFWDILNQDSGFFQVWVGLGLVHMFYFGLFNIGHGLLKTFGSALGTVWVGAIFISRPPDADFMHDFRPFCHSPRLRR